MDHRVSGYHGKLPRLCTRWLFETAVSQSAEVSLMFRRLLIVVALLVMSAPALGVNPETEVAGATSKWFTGELIQQTGLNCSTAILGEPYTEVMVSGYSSYGGAPNGGLPRVGQGYYTSLLLAIPGNPCGSGVSAVETEVILPPGTQVDTSRPIRCFGQPRGANTFLELTGGTWSHLGSTGAYCPTQVGPAIYTQGAVSVGFRPIVNGQFFQVFVPVISSTQLVGLGNFNDRFMWTVTATGVYANPALSSVWANVFPASNVGQGPFVYFARQPAAIPYWDAAASSSPDLRNRVELFANFYTAGLAGIVSYVMTRTDTNATVWSSSSDPSFNGAVGAGQDLVQINATGTAAGPNGGYSPVAFDPPGTPGNVAGEWNVPMRVTWTFTPTGGVPVSGTSSFTTLPGPDGDGDGVADATDACPLVKGTLANGCLPSPLTDPDGDGVFGVADLCPIVDGKGRLDGCPPVAPSPPLVTTSVGTKKQAIFRSAALAKGIKVPITCTGAVRVTVRVVVTKKLAKARLALAAPAAGLIVASGIGDCSPGATVMVKLVSKPKLRTKLRALKAFLPAQLVVKVPSPNPSPKVVTIRLR